MLRVVVHSVKKMRRDSSQVPVRARNSSLERLHVHVANVRARSHVLSCDNLGRRRSEISVRQNKNGRLVKSRPFVVTKYDAFDYGLRSVQPVKFGFAFSALATGRLIV
jgi:hypothetical protein